MSALASWTLLVGLVAVFVVRAVRQERRIRSAERHAEVDARIRGTRFPDRSAWDRQ